MILSPNFSRFLLQLRDNTVVQLDGLGSW